MLTGLGVLINVDQHRDLFFFFMEIPSPGAVAATPPLRLLLLKQNVVMSKIKKKRDPFPNKCI